MDSIKRKVCIRNSRSSQSPFVRRKIRPRYDPHILATQALAAQALIAIDDGVVISNPNLPGNPIIFVNEGFTRTTGYSADEVVGENCRFLQGPDTEPAAIEE